MSYYCEKKNMLFIHVPKCAGTSMEKCDWIQRGGHKRYAMFEQEKSINKNTFSFGFVRNPYDRMVSLFHSARSNTVAWPKVPPDFNRYIRMIWEDGKYVLPHERTQTHFLMDIEGNIGVSYVGHFENLKDDWEYVCAKVGAPKEDAELKWMNRNKHAPWEEIVNNESIRIINRMYRCDFINFNYPMR